MPVAWLDEDMEGQSRIRYRMLECYPNSLGVPLTQACGLVSWSPPRASRRVGVRFIMPPHAIPV